MATSLNVRTTDVRLQLYSCLLLQKLHTKKASCSPFIIVIRKGGTILTYNRYPQAQVWDIAAFPEHIAKVRIYHIRRFRIRMNQTVTDGYCLKCQLISRHLRQHPFIGYYIYIYN